jgi:hypothetical protein
VPDRRVRLGTLAALALLCGSAAADDSKKPDPTADSELLEFLGSVDSGADSQAAADDGSWIDYLAETDIGKVAKSADPNEDASRPKPPATGTQPAASGDKKDD